MKIFGAIAAVALMVAGTVHAAETVTITDVAGREVSVKVPAEKLILGEGRLIYGLATLDTDAPFKRVVGWRDDLKKAVDIIGEIEGELEFETVDASPNVAKISVVGTAMRTQPGVAKTMFETLASKGVNMHVISTSEIKISVLIDSEYTELAVRSLHTAYGLDDVS